MRYSGSSLFLALVAAPFGHAMGVFLPLMIVAAVVPVVYSYLLSRRAPR